MKRMSLWLATGVAVVVTAAGLMSSGVRAQGTSGCFEYNNTLLVADREDQQLVRLNATTGGVVQTITHPDFTGAGADLTDVQVYAPTGEIYVGVDLDGDTATGDGEIVRFDALGNPVGVTPLPDDAGGVGFFYPRGFDIDADGSVWVAQPGDEDVLHVNTSGVVVRDYDVSTITGAPVDAAVGTGNRIYLGAADGDLAVLDRVTGVVTVLVDVDGAGTNTIPSIEVVSSVGLGLPAGVDALRIALHDTGDVQLRRGDTGALIRTELSGGNVRSIDTAQQGGVNGEVFVSREFDNRIDVVNPANGTVLRSLTGGGTLDDPFGIALATNATALTFTSTTTTNTVGNETCETVTVTNEQGQPVANACVHFQLVANGAQLETAEVSTDTNGQAQFCFTPLFTNVQYQVQAFVDQDNDFVQDGNEPAANGGSRFFNAPLGAGAGNIRVNVTANGDVNLPTAVVIPTSVRGGGGPGFGAGPLTTAHFVVNARSTDRRGRVRGGGGGGGGNQGQFYFDVATLHLKGHGTVDVVTAQGNTATLFGTLRLRQGQRRRAITQDLPYRLDLLDISPRSAGYSGETGDQFLLTVLTTDDSGQIPAAKIRTIGDPFGFGTTATIGGPLVRGNVRIEPKVGVSPAFPPFALPADPTIIGIGGLAFGG